MCGHPGQGGLLCAHVDCLLNTLRQKAVEGAVRVGANDEVTDVLVLRDTEGAEENPEGNVGLHARHGCAEQMNLGVFRVIHDLHRIGFRYLVIVGADRLHFNHLHLLCRIAIVAKHDGAIGRHTLLGNNDALAAADDEIAAIVFRALPEGDRGEMLLVVEEAVLGSHHHGNLAEMDVGE